MLIVVWFANATALLTMKIEDSWSSFGSVGLCREAHSAKSSMYNFDYYFNTHVPLKVTHSNSLCIHFGVNHSKYWNYKHEKGSSYYKLSLSLNAMMIVSFHTYPSSTEYQYTETE